MKSVSDLIRRVLSLAWPYGRRKVAYVVSLSLIQGIFQVVGVTSIFPFLAVAANPAGIRESEIGAKVLGWLPAMSDHQLLMFAGMVAIAALVVSNVINLLAEFYRKYYANHFAHWLRMRLMGRIVSQPYGFFLRGNSSVLVKKVTGDVTGYTNKVLTPVLDIVTYAFTTALLLITLLAINPMISLGFGLALGLAYGTIFRSLGSKRTEIRLGLKAANKGAMKAALQLFSGIKAIKVHQAENYFIGSYSAHSAEQARHNAWMPVFSNGPRYIIEPFVFGGLVLSVLILAARGQDLISILPTLGVMAVAGYRLLPAMQKLYGDMTMISASTHYLDEICAEFEATAGVKETSSERNKRIKPRSKPLDWHEGIRLVEVSFGYPGAAQPVLDRVSLYIEKSSSVAVVGRTGSGKSTLIDLLLGLHEPSSGRIEIDGHPLTPKLVPSWQASIGYVPQDIYLTDDSIAMNIALGISPETVDRERVREVCRMAQILDFIEQELPQGFETQVGERGVRLSGGQRQRLGIARALYQRPSLLVLDEATSALDGETEAAVMSSIGQLYGKLTIVIIAHRLSTLEKCDRRLELERGRVKDQASLARPAGA
jgi:ATP-binding cassette, subfamily B, bacterial PglK